MNKKPDTKAPLSYEQIRQKLSDTLTIRGISQNSLARETGISQPTISSFLKGHDINMTSLRILNRWLGMGCNVISDIKHKSIVLSKFEVGGKIYVVEVRELIEGEV
jgi:transcriptional regulator with XRE-family HTH domain